MSSCTLDFSLENKTTLKLDLYIVVFGLIVCLIAASSLWSHFKKTSASYGSFAFFKITTLSPLIILIALYMLYIIGHHHLFTIFGLKHIYSSLIEQNCNFVMILQSIFIHISKFSMWLFLSSRVRYFFIDKPFEMSSSSYHLQIIWYLALSIFGALLYIEYGSPTMYIAADNDEYKKCGFEANKHFTASLIVMSVIDTFINIYLFYSLWDKTKLLEIYHEIESSLSPFYNPPSNGLINTNVLNRCIISGFMYFILDKIIVSLYVLYQIQCLFGLYGIAACMIVLYSFDLHICPTQQNQNDEAEGVELSQDEERRLQVTMDAFKRINA